MTQPINIMYYMEMDFCVLAMIQSCPLTHFWHKSTANANRTEQNKESNFACCGIFCDLHKTHEHFKCHYDNCFNQALDCIAVTGKVYCGYHQDIMLNTTFSSCYDCGKALTYDRASIRHCVTCNGTSSEKIRYSRSFCFVIIIKF